VRALRLGRSQLTRMPIKSQSSPRSSSINRFAVPRGRRMSGQSSKGSPGSCGGRMTPVATSSSNRRFTSSCGTPWPASSSAMRRSICATNTSFSIASSFVASADSSRSSSMMRSRVSGSVTIEFYASLPSLAVRNDASPPDWAQIWAHEFSNAANRSKNSTSQGRPSLPWAHGVAGSNPVARPLFGGPYRTHG
jgi:hypothetical protein